MTANGGCDASLARMTFQATVLLPRRVDERALDPALAASWDRLISALRVHEAGHLRHALEHRQDILIALRGSTCAMANSAGEAVVDSLRAWDKDYDASTRHGQTQGAVFP